MTSIEPTASLDLGGWTVVVNGRHFQSGATVRFDAREAADVRVLFSADIIAVTPAHPVGTVDVTVTNPDGQFYTVEEVFVCHHLKSIHSPALIAQLGPSAWG